MEGIYCRRGRMTDRTLYERQLDYMFRDLSYTEADIRKHIREHRIDVAVRKTMRTYGLSASQMVPFVEHGKKDLPLIPIFSELARWYFHETP